MDLFGLDAAGSGAAAPTIERHFGKVLVWTAICGLTGVTSCMLAPGYLARAYVDRSGHFALLGVCSRYAR